MIAVEYILIAAAVLLLSSVLASKVSDRFGVPALLLFLAVGMLAGSDGPGGIYFDDAALAQGIGVSALALILFSGGLDTNWASVRPVLREGAALSSLGVLFTASLVAAASQWLLGLPFGVALLLGATVSSTDAAAVLAILRSRSVSLQGKLRPLLELESGSNDPMAVFLTVGVIQVLTAPQTTAQNLIILFVQQMLVGAVAGYALGHALLSLINHIRLNAEGLYPVLTLSWVLLTYAGAVLVGGNGFLAVYIAGVLIGKHDFIHKRSLMRFHDGIAWLMQIAMFLTLGLLVFPSQLESIAIPGLLLAVFLMLVARPAGVFASLIFSRMSIAEKTFVAWVGLRGATPIILATYPLLAGIPQSETIFNIVFFVVLTSAVLQGFSVPYVARLLKVDAPTVLRTHDPIEYTPVRGARGEMRELSVPAGSPLVGKALVDLSLPENFLIVLIVREDAHIVPSGATVLAGGDRLLALGDRAALQHMEQRLAHVYGA